MPLFFALIEDQLLRKWLFISILVLLSPDVTALHRPESSRYRVGIPFTANEIPRFKVM